MSVGDNSQSVKFMGIEQMKKQFDALPGTLQRWVLRQAVAAGGTALARAIRRATPKGETGNLKKAVKKKPSSKWRSGRQAASKGIIGTTIGHQRPQGAHSHLVDQGHKAVYWGKASTDRVAGANYFYKAVGRVKGEVRAKITTKAKAALVKAITKSLVPKKR